MIAQETLVTDEEQRLENDIQRLVRELSRGELTPEEWCFQRQTVAARLTEVKHGSVHPTAGL